MELHICFLFVVVFVDTKSKKYKPLFMKSVPGDPGALCYSGASQYGGHVFYLCSQMRCRQLALCILFTIPAARVAAQFNDSVFYHFNAVASGSLNRTNDVTNYLLNNALKFSARKKSVSANISNSWIYGQQQKTPANNDYTGTLDINLYKTFPGFYYWGLGNYTTSLSLKINNQYQYGLGIAYSIFDTANIYLNVSDGIIYENSDIIVDDTSRQTYSTFRNSFRLSFRFVAWDVFIINGTGFLQNSLEYKNDYILRGNFAASLRLRRYLGITAAISYNKISRTGRENLLFTYGVTIDNYF